MFRIDVPYYSQHQDVIEPSWRSRSCGIACTKMVLNYLKPDNKELIDDLIEEGVLVGGYSKNGWDHESIVRLLRNRGISAYREEFRSVLVDSAQRKFLKSTYENPMLLTGIKKIKKCLECEKPVIVSVEPYFSENTESHLVVLTGFLEDKENGLEGFFYNDPDSKFGVKKDNFIELPKFKKMWRKMAIFVAE